MLLRNGMKTLLTTHQFFPEYGAGTEVLTYSVARELIARGHEVRILTAFPNEKEMCDEERFDEYQYDDIPIYRFHHSYVPMAEQHSMVELSFDNNLAASYFKKILAVFKPDVVHFFHFNRLGTGLVEYAVQAGIPVYFTPTDFWSICPVGQLMLPGGKLCFGPNTYSGNCVKHFAENTQNGLVGSAAKWLPTIFADNLVRLTQANVMPPYPHRIEVKAIGSRLSKNISRLNQLNKIVSPNKFMTEKLIQYGVSPNLIVPLAFGIDVHSGVAAQPRDLSRQPFRVGYIGTLAPHKGCHILVEAFKSLPFGAAILKIYGNKADFPEYSKELEERASQHRNIEFCGVFPNYKIAEVMADIDVLVVPSLWFENTPLVLYSAQAASCPVVASDFPGISEVIRDQINGLLFEPGNVAALTNQLTRLINETALIERLSTNSKQPKSTAKYVDELLSIWDVA